MLDGSPRPTGMLGKAGNGGMDKSSGVVDAVEQGGLRSLGTGDLLEGSRGESCGRRTGDLDHLYEG